MTLRVPVTTFCALLALAGCAEPAPVVPVQELERAADQALRALGEGRFEVLEMHPRGGAPFELVDDFLYHTRLYALDFDGRVRCPAALSVEGPGELDEHLGDPKWTLEDTDRGLSLLAVLGPGDLAAGRVLDVHASAVFEEVAPGRYRFHNFDRAGRASTP